MKVERGLGQHGPGSDAEQWYKCVSVEGKAEKFAGKLNVKYGRNKEIVTE